MVKVQTNQDKIIFWFNLKEIEHLIKGGEVCLEKIEKTPIKSDTIKAISFVGNKL